MIITAQAIFDAHLKGLNNYVAASVRTKDHYLIIAEAMLAITRELLSQNLSDNDALQIMEQALQDSDTKTYH